MRKTIRRLGGKLKVPRKSHVKKDAKAAAEFRGDLSNRLAKAVEPSPNKAVRIWVLDEHRYGLLPVIRRVWGEEASGFMGLAQLIFEELKKNPEFVRDLEALRQAEWTPPLPCPPPDIE